MNYAGAALASGYIESNLKDQAFIGQHTAGMNVPVQPTVTQVLAGRLEAIGKYLEETAVRQCSLLERLHGPRPEEKNPGSPIAPPCGTLGIISERLGYVESLAKKVLDTQTTLDHLA